MKKFLIGASAAFIALLALSVFAVVSFFGTDTFDAKGEFALINDDGCDTGGTGYSDIYEGAQVTVRDSKGEILAVSELTNEEEHEGILCGFKYKVTEIPVTDNGIYTFEVSDRGELEFSQDESRKLFFSLGDPEDLY